MATKRMVKCPNCGVFNTNKEYCTNCNTLISHKKKREIRAEAGKEKRVKEAIYEKENPNLAERLKKHPNIFYKMAGWILYSAILVVSTIGAGLAWFIAMVAAG
ncbi:hypothetical protein [uncultured Polaribacter sp.]|uniref:hypothetical protein n=1 Tax=uncultured Polaribacter sp. TaxID=174711 RepID=UPI00262EB9A4|nr:hypothetical protein [uncultured Polaribacter sp.]